MIKQITIILVLSLVLSGCGRALETKDNNNKQSNIIPIKVDDQDIEDTYSLRLTSPQTGQVLKSPFLVGGEAQLSDDIVYIRIKKSNGDILISEQTKISTTEAGDKGPFSVLINFNFQSTDQGIVEAYGVDSETGEEVVYESIEVSFDLSSSVSSPNGN
jgi:hypothetical protein